MVMDKSRFNYNTQDAMRHQVNKSPDSTQTPPWRLFIQFYRPDILEIVDFNPALPYTLYHPDLCDLHIEQLCCSLTCKLRNIF